MQYGENGPAAGTTLVELDVTVADGVVYLVDDSVSFRHADGRDSGDDPSSESHLGF